MDNKEDLIKQLKRLEQENAELKADLKSLEYTVVLQSKRDIDNATDLFAKHIAKIESENSILKAEKAKYYQQTLDDEIQINELLQTLQEIKTIAEGIRNATYQFGQEVDQKFFNETLGKILQKITKAEVGE